MSLRLLAFSALLLLCLALAGAASAQTPGINLSWNDCGAAGAQDKTLANCGSSDSGEQVFYGSLVAPAGITLTSANLWLGIVTATPTLPDWWTIGGPPSCRSGPINQNGTDLSLTYGAPCASATDYWSTVPNGPFGDAMYAANPQPGTPHMVPGTNHAGIYAFVAVDNGLAYTLTAGQQYYLMTVTLKNTSSTTCTGCDVATCILFNLVEIFEPQTVVSGPPLGGRDFITWQGGASAPCAEVPVRTETWGRIKSVYR